MKELRMILTTGGTGGHIFPALALAGEMRRLRPEARILFLGGRQGPEAGLAREAGLEFASLPARGFLGRGLAAVPAAWDMARSLLLALRHMRRFCPGLVVGFGGYAAFAGVLAAVVSGVPAAIHEQNSLPGLSNRILARLVRTVFLSLPDTGGFFDARKTVLTGNPVRPEIAALHGRAERRTCEAGKERSRCRLLVLGGSQGARAINNAMIAIAGDLLKAGLEIVLQTGRDDCERVRESCLGLDAEKLDIRPFIDDMAAAYAWADLALCRAGASTLAELCAAGLPSLLVPYPHAANDHQRLNAATLEKAGAARVLEQAVFSGAPDRLSAALLSLLQDGKKLRSMTEAALSLARPLAARSLAEAALRMISPDAPEPDNQGAADAQC
ncbi:MAG: undecaprenyldiphospho-muramoylpentapeptide beta-N-acetylglucosaminyltransferase [Desulfovibrio sp.]|jgi:UDP-N-acetylglucosamine--N-acetylmuramyl-(pentapeptide) pyrophosphoryl-undecaprenol N-acetylglucosamine transferase|nr:undecaprenyldiphospho-muramoylpentapeptide beta-N-acetylglucosaminyltransferase [Desulfovibrio sp.]